MGQYADLLRALPRTRRSVRDRKAAKTLEVVRIAKQFGPEYFDDSRMYGYGGYVYDGRWILVAQDILNHYGLIPDPYPPRILDVGCAKGYLVHDLRQHGGADAYGLDVSRYALEHCRADDVGRLHWGRAQALPFPARSFDLVLSINTLHNLPREEIKTALREMQRVSRGRMFVQVDTYRTPAERALFEDWVLTAEFHGYPDDWLALFREAGYDGDYAWTIVEEQDGDEEGSTRGGGAGRGLPG